MNRHLQVVLLLFGSALAGTATQCTSFGAADAPTTPEPTPDADLPGADGAAVDSSPIDAGGKAGCTLEFVDDFEREDIATSSAGWAGVPTQTAGATLQIDPDHYRGTRGARASVPGNAGTAAYLERGLGMRSRVRLSFAVHRPSVVARTVTFNTILINSLKTSIYFSFTGERFELREQDFRVNSSTVVAYDLGKVGTEWHFVTMTLDLAAAKPTARVEVDGNVLFMAPLKYQWAPGVVSLRAGTSFVSAGDPMTISFDDVGVCTEP